MFAGVIHLANRRANVKLAAAAAAKADTDTETEESTTESVVAVEQTHD